jgi:hypothetical protein
MLTFRSTDRAKYGMNYKYIAENFSWIAAEDKDGSTVCVRPSADPYEETGLIGSEEEVSIGSADAADLSAWDQYGDVYEWALHHAPESIELVGERMKRDFETLEDFLADTDERSVDTRTDWSHVIYEDDGIIYSKVPTGDGGMIAVELNDDYTVRKTL